MKVTYQAPGNVFSTTKKYHTVEEMRARLASIPRNAKGDAERVATEAAIADYDKCQKEAVARAQRETEAAEKRRIDRNDETRLATVKLTALVRSMLQPDAKFSDAENLVRREVAQKWLELQQEIEDRALRLLHSPGYYFEWAEYDMKYAAEREILDWIVTGIVKPERTVSIHQMLKNMQEDLTDRLLSNQYRGGSTSQAHNAMDHCRREIVAQYVGRSYGSRFGRWVRKTAPVITEY